MILLDTHVLFWLGDDSPRLGRGALARLREEQGGLRASVMCYWELAMLQRKGRMAFTMPVVGWLDEVVRNAGIELVPVTAAIAAEAGGLGDPLHGDPLDRVMVATARALGCPIMTADGKILRYAAAGHVQALDARR